MNLRLCVYNNVLSMVFMQLSIVSLCYTVVNPNIVVYSRSGRQCTYDVLFCLTSGDYSL